MPNIYEYDNYRTFLRDFFVERKTEDSKFSHRYFAQKAGIRSSGFCSEVLKGTRNLTSALIPKFCTALRLNKTESEYFRNLVGFCQATLISEKTQFCQNLLSCSSAVSIRSIDKDKFEFYGRWYYSAVREMVYYCNFVDDFEKLGRDLCPPISAREAKGAIDLLVRLDLIRKGEDGVFHQTTPLITTGSGFRSLNVARFQRETMDLAKDALDRFPGEMRDSSTLTLTLSKESVEQARHEVSQLRKKLLAIARNDQAVDRVYQFNFQLFPLTSIKE